MILISSDKYDRSTNDIIDWLMAAGQNFVRVNREDQYRIDFNSASINIDHDMGAVAVDALTAYWFRRGKIGLSRSIPEKLAFMNDYLTQEQEIFNQYLHFKLGTKALSDYYNSEPNKLIVLEQAKAIGLTVPETFILSQKKALKKILNTHRLITKGATAGGVFEIGNEFGIIYTNEITKEMVNKMPDTFFPSVFQERVNKVFELRVFVLGEKCWAMAIFSQQDQQTETDFRRYNNDTPNRTVPYQLPADIEQKLVGLIQKMNLNSGSIDIMVSDKEEYVFLEVNPIGQFGMVSYPCNYNLENEVANYLMK